MSFHETVSTNISSYFVPSVPGVMDDEKPLKLMKEVRKRKYLNGLSAI